MAATSGLIGGLLAAAIAERPNWLNFALAVVGLVIAHGANNMTNDYFDLEGGVDTDEYARGQDAPHPIVAGLDPVCPGPHDGADGQTHRQAPGRRRQGDPSDPGAHRGETRAGSQHGL